MGRAAGIHEKDELPKELGVDTSHLALAATAVLVCVIAPVAEEFIFRGYIFPALRNWKGLWPAVVLDGLIFGAIHAGSAPVGYLFPLALFGMVSLPDLPPDGVADGLHGAPRAEQLDRVRRQGEVGWSWPDPLVFLGAVAVIGAGAVVRRVFGPAPPFPSPVYAPARASLVQVPGDRR